MILPASSDRAVNKQLSKKIHDGQQQIVWVLKELWRGKGPSDKRSARPEKYRKRPQDVASATLDFVLDCTQSV